MRHVRHPATERAIVEPDEARKKILKIRLDKKLAGVLGLRQLNKSATGDKRNASAGSE